MERKHPTARTSEHRKDNQNIRLDYTSHAATIDSKVWMGRNAATEKDNVLRKVALQPAIFIVGGRKFNRACYTINLT